MTERAELRKFLDAVKDDAYEVAELWSITRGPGRSEDEARRRARDALLELERRGYVKVSRKVEPGQWQNLTTAEIQSIRDDLAAWGVGVVDVPNMHVTTTAEGDEALRRGEFG